MKNIELILQILTYLTVSCSLVLMFFQVWKNTRTNQASFWLDLRTIFESYDEIHRSLQSDKTWRNKDREVTDDEVISIVGYMGLFEHCYSMLKEGLIDRTTFVDIYSYRIHVIMASPVIVRATLVNNGRYWERFRTLAKDMGHDVPERKDYEIAHQEIGFPVGWNNKSID